jgi:hypothetical protein
MNRSMIRPNIRRVTSTAARYATIGDYLKLTLMAIALSASGWIGLFLYITR